MKQGTAVVVTTKHRGVFFGCLEDETGDKVTLTTGDKVTLTGARCCVYWSAGTRGFMGLAATGPASGSRVTSAAPKIDLYGVTAVVECSPEAVKAWEAAPWS